MRVRSVSAMILTAVMAVGLPVAERDRRAEAALDRPYPIHVVDIAGVTFSPLDDVRDIAPDGRFAVVAPWSSPESLIALPDPTSPAVLPLAGFHPHDGGVFAYKLGGLHSILRLRLATREIDEVVVPLDAGVIIEDVVDMDASGRVFLLVARRLVGTGNPRSVFVFNAVTGELTAPYGVHFGSPDPAPTPKGLSRDGRFVTATAHVLAGSDFRFPYWRVDLLTGEGLVREDTTGSFGTHPFVVSDDMNWSVFVSDAADVVPGLPAGRRLYRRNLLTEQTVVVPVDMATVKRYAVFDGGRVVVSHEVATPADATSRQLSVWEGVGPLVMMTVGVDGEPADLGVDEWDVEFEANADASRISFTSLATNLAPAMTTVQRRLFQVVLPSLSPAGPAAVVLPDESVCVPVPGAVPGELVGVNVTPVGAAVPGFGVVHSSDARAGSTSNVNFGSGTTDPNVAFVPVGVDGEVCYTNSRHGSVEVVVDAMTVAAAGTLRPVSEHGSGIRLLDTRAGDPVASAASVCIVPAGATAGEYVGLNVTPVDATTFGYGTLHESGRAPGLSSTVNFGPGTVDPNFAFVRVGADGQVCFANSVHGPVDVIVDQLVIGTSSMMRPPVVGADGGRPVDTRTGVGGSRLAPSGEVCFAVADSVPGEFVGVNVTPVGAATPGYGTVHPSGSAPGEVSNVNFGPGTVDPNFAMTQVGADGKVCFTNSVHGAVDVIIDAQVIGAADAFRLPSADGSVRILDTREARP